MGHTSNSKLNEPKKTAKPIWGDTRLALYQQIDLVGSDGRTQSRSTLQILFSQLAYAFLGLGSAMTKLVQQDSAVGLDERSCRMYAPMEIPKARSDDLKTKRIIKKFQKAKGDDSIVGKIRAYRGL